MVFPCFNGVNVILLSIVNLIAKLLIKNDLKFKKKFVGRPSVTEETTNSEESDEGTRQRGLNLFIMIGNLFISS